MSLHRSGRNAPFLWCGVPTDDVDDQALGRLGTILDADEQARIDRLRQPQDRRDAIISHGLRRLMLASLTGRPAESFRFYRDRPGGKPKVQGGCGIDISLTHCPGYAAVAASKGGRIGIDAEALGRAIEPEVVAVIARKSEGAAAGEPAVLWTMKEALAKAEGSGLALDLTAIEIDHRRSRLVAAPSSFGNPRSWTLERHRHAGFAVAIAFGPSARP